MVGSFGAVAVLLAWSVHGVGGRGREPDFRIQGKLSIWPSSPRSEGTRSEGTEAPLPEADLIAMNRYVELSPKRAEAAGFAKAPEPQPGDWRLGPGKNETHQSFYEFWKGRCKQRPRGEALVLRWLGPSPASLEPTKEALRRFLSLYYQQPVRWGSPLQGSFRTRATSDSPSGGIQYHTEPILEALAKRVPEDARLVMGLTLHDLYPEESWSFVFGEAAPHHRVGLYSLARLSPAFHTTGVDDREKRAALVRAMKVLVHEVGHIMGLSHCVKFSCLMAGSNSLEEADRQPLHLCPVCLSKIAWSLDLDVRARYESLARFLRSRSLEVEARWYELQTARLGPGKAAGLKTRP
jgi:archaemetzincin